MGECHMREERCLVECHGLGEKGRQVGRLTLRRTDGFLEKFPRLTLRFGEIWHRKNS